jgi:hypothetical protein
MLRSSIAAKDGSDDARIVTNILVCDLAREEELGIGRGWPYRRLGEGEAHVTASVLSSLCLQGRRGDRARVDIGFGKLLATLRRLPRKLALGNPSPWGWVLALPPGRGPAARPGGQLWARTRCPPCFSCRWCVQTQSKAFVLFFVAAGDGCWPWAPSPSRAAVDPGEVWWRGAWPVGVAPDRNSGRVRLCARPDGIGEDSPWVGA